MIIPVGDRLLVEPIPVEEMTAGGIFLPDSAREVPDKGKILAVGDKVEETKLTEGVTVLFRKGSGSSIRDNSKELIVLPIKEVIGILKEDK